MPLCQHQPYSFISAAAHPANLYFADHNTSLVYLPHLKTASAVFAPSAYPLTRSPSDVAVCQGDRILVTTNLLPRVLFS